MLLHKIIKKIDFKTIYEKANNHFIKGMEHKNTPSR